MSPRPRLVAGVFVITALMVIVATALMYWLGSRSLQAHAREQSRREAILNLKQLVATLKDGETGQRGYLLTGDETCLEPFNDAAKSLADTVGKIREAEHLGFSRDSIQKIVRLIQEEIAELRTGIQLRRNGDSEAVGAVMKAGEGRKLMEDLRSAIGSLEQEQIKRLRDDSRRTDEAIRLRTLVFLLSGCGTILFLGWSYRRITQAVEEREAAAVMHRRPE